MLEEGAPFGPFHIRHRLGAGGMGEVYLAFDSRLQRDVALKVLAAGGDEAASTRLIREARLASTLSHHHICTVFEAGEIDGQAFIAMERLVGDTLSAIVQAGPLPLERVIRLGSQIADGLAHAHAQGIVHRDLKSANIVVSADGRAKILDFGLAVRIVPDTPAHTGVMTHSIQPDHAFAGTMAYMPPEILKGGTADSRGDIWSLGVVLFEMTSGRRPFSGGTPYELTSAILTAPVPDLRSVPAGLRTIIARCLAKEPGERYQTAAEVQAALETVASTSGEAVPVERSRRQASTKIAVVAGLAVLLAAAGTVAWRSRSASKPVSGAGGIQAIAVLPLANLSGDASQEYFADGMTEALITDLARVKGLAVISRTSVMQYKGTRKTLREIARELAVDAVVEGSVIRAGDRVRITAQLIEASSDRHLWANDYDRDARDVLALQHDVARTIAREVRTTLTPQVEARLSGGRRVDPAVHDKYLRARALVYRYDEPSIAQAIALFEEVLRIDPEFAEAWAGLASAHSERGIWGVATSRETGSRAHAAIARALALDSASAEAYAVLGNISNVYDWDWTAAERALTRSIELAPGDARSHQYYAALLQGLRRFPEAVAEAELNQRLDPASSLSASTLGRARYRARRFDAAIEAFRQAIALDPALVPTYARLADVYIALGRYDEATTWLDKGQKIAPDSRRQTDGYGVVYALSGRRAEAEAIVRELAARARSSDQVAYSLAMVQTALGQHDQAIEWLNRGYEAHSANMWLVNGELKFDALRSDPRFQDLLRRMHFPS